MTRLFRKWFGGEVEGQDEREAREAEERGDLARAAALLIQAGRLDDAARVMIRRGDAEPKPAARVRHYARAAGTAMFGSEIQLEARAKRAIASAAAAGESPATSAARRELLEAARELEELGRHAQAAQIYARARDVEGQARSLENAGDIDALEGVLDGEQQRERDALGRRRDAEEFMLLVASGRRREAARLARASSDPPLRARGRELEARRVLPESLRATFAGVSAVLVLGDSLVIGRSPGTPGETAETGDSREARLAVPSAALSRRHLAVERTRGVVMVRDLGSRNGTAAGAARLTTAHPIGDGLTLTLGREVAVSVAPAPELAGAVAVEIGGSRYVATLGPARIGVGAWRIEWGDDGWVDLVTDDRPPAFAGAMRTTAVVQTMQWAPRSTLVEGDAIGDARGGPARLTVAR
jgi:FHA domain